MRRIILTLSVFLLVLLLGIVGKSDAALIVKDLTSPGDGQITYDSETGLSWLDLTNTYRISYGNVLAGYGGYTTNLGFRFATNSDISTLLKHAGITEGRSTSWDGTNINNTRNLINLLGVTYTDGHTFLANGYVSDPNRCAALAVNDIGEYDAYSNILLADIPGYFEATGAGSFLVREEIRGNTIIFKETLPDNLGPLDGGELSYSVTSSGPSLPGAAILTFDLLGYGSVDGANCCPDTFQLTINNQLLFSGGFNMGGGGSNFINYIDPGVTILSSNNFGWFGGGLTQFKVLHTLKTGTNTYRFDYGAMQGLGDEGWGLRSPIITAYVVTPVPLFGDTLRTLSSYDFSLEQNAQKTATIQLINPGNVARSASLDIVNPHSGMAVSITQQNPISIAPGATVTVPLAIDAGSMPIGIYDDLLLKVTVDDGSVLYSNIKIIIGAGNLPDLTISSSDIRSTMNSDSTVTLTATVHNRGSSSASNVQVRFFDFGTQLGDTVISQVAANGLASTSITVPLASPGEHLIRVVIDPLSLIQELGKSNNEASKIILLGGSSGPTQGNLLVTGSLPSTVYTNSLFTLSGQAVYDVYVNGVRYTNYVVKGGSAQITVTGYDGTHWVYGDVHTDLNGNFSKSIQAPASPGTYNISMTVTDNTFIGKRDLVFNAINSPPPSNPTPPPNPPFTSGSGNWTYSGGTGGTGGTWTWTWTTPPTSGPVPQSDLSVYSENIHFSKNNPAQNEEITVFAEIKYWATSTALVAQNVPVNLYFTKPGDPKVKIGQTLINSLSVGAPDFGSRYVYGTWKNQGQGIYIVEAEIDPSYTEENILNNAATRAIIAGQLQSQQGVISGHVTNPWGGVGNVIIQVFDTNGANLYGATTTDATGFYHFDNVPVGAMQVRIVSPSGYIPDAATKAVTVADQTVSVVDFHLSVQPTPPVLNLPANITTEATSPGGAIVSYTASATDAVDGSVAPICTPASGSIFALGVTPVTCSATNNAGYTANGSFTVTVRDTTPPKVTVPANITTEATGSSGATVTYIDSAMDLVDGAVTPACNPASGSTFAVGTTNVTCNATDKAGNTGSGSFNVTISKPIQICGDLNGDGKVDTTDYGIFRNALGKMSGQSGFSAAADMDADGIVSLKDYSTWYACYLKYRK